jgi:molybdenum cofactor synthesis domain-containing protein
MGAEAGGNVVTAAAIIIGNEILSGRTQDTNLAYIAQGLNEVGIVLHEARVIPDVPAMIVASVNELRARHDYVFTTGGIGPTHDDITTECIARAFGVPWTLHPEAHRILEEAYRDRPGQLNEARLRMAHAPEGATLILNPVSRAPGFRIGNVFILAGIPSVMQAMFDAVKPTLEGGAPILSRTVACRLAEGVLAKGLGEIQARFSDLDIGSYPWYRRGEHGVSLVARGRDAARLDACAAAITELVRALGDAPRME